MFYRLLIISSLSLIITACGFQLRGAVQLPESLNIVYVESIQADRVAHTLRQKLLNQGVQLAPSRQAAKMIIQLKNENTHRRMLSVSAVTGKLREVELSQSVTLSLKRNDGHILQAEQRLNLSREFVFDEQAVLAKGEEEQVLKIDLLNEIVNDILRRIRFFKNQKDEKQI